MTKRAVKTVLFPSSGCSGFAYPPIRFSVKITGGSVLSYHITETEAIRFVDIRIPLTGDMEENQRTVPGFWKETLGEKQFSDICLLSDENPKEQIPAARMHKSLTLRAARTCCGAACMTRGEY